MACGYRSTSTKRLTGSDADEIWNTGSRPSPPSVFGRRCFGRFSAAASATDIPPVPGETVPSSAMRISRLGPEIRTPNVRPEAPVAGKPSPSSFMARNMSCAAIATSIPAKDLSWSGTSKCYQNEVRRVPSSHRHPSFPLNHSPVASRRSPISRSIFTPASPNMRDMNAATGRSIRAARPQNRQFIGDSRRCEPASGTIGPL